MPSTCKAFVPPTYSIPYTIHSNTLPRYPESIRHNLSKPSVFASSGSFASPSHAPSRGTSSVPWRPGPLVRGRASASWPSHARDFALQLSRLRRLFGACGWCLHEWCGPCAGLRAGNVRLVRECRRRGRSIGRLAGRWCNRRRRGFG